MLVRRDVLAVSLPFPAVLDLVAAPTLHDRWTLVDYRRHADQVSGARWATAPAELGPQLRRRVEDVRARAEARLRLLDALEERLTSAGPVLEPSVGQQLADLRAHLEVRADLSGPRGRRVAPVLRQVLVGGYRRFGSGPASAVLDIMRR
jgi:hypothetical protein